MPIRPSTGLTEGLTRLILVLRSGLRLLCAGDKAGDWTGERQERSDTLAIIDFHNHVYPPAYVREIEAGPSAFKVTYDADNNPVLHSPGDYNILTLCTIDPQ
jgi:hypothetical protein